MIQMKDIIYGHKYVHVLGKLFKYVVYGLGIDMQIHLPYFYVPVRHHSQSIEPFLPHGAPWWCKLNAHTHS